MALPTLLDMVKLKGNDATVGLVEEAIRATPELTGMSGGRTIANVGYSRPIAGTTFKTLVRTGLPTAGFRNANAGAADSKSTFENRLVECFILNPRWKCDKAVADVHEDGPEAYIAIEGVGMVAAAFMALATQFYYGRTSPGDAAGHPGLIDAVQSSLTVDATGTTANTGSSVWGVKWGPSNVGWCVGKNGSIDQTDVRVESVADPADATKSFTAYVQELLAHVGVQVASIYSVGRIKNLTADSGKGLTDARLGSLLALYPVGWAPDVFFLSRRSLEQLRASRTATNATGAPAPTPTDYEGIPLIPTDAILNNEAIT